MLNIFENKGIYGLNKDIEWNESHKLFIYDTYNNDNDNRDNDNDHDHDNDSNNDHDNDNNMEIMDIKKILKINYSIFRNVSVVISLYRRQEWYVTGLDLGRDREKGEVRLYE
jgi:ABC-type Zn2+ transport system substrate-binding protein/surface adhesin